MFRHITIGPSHRHSWAFWGHPLVRIGVTWQRYGAWRMRCARRSSSAIIVLRLYSWESLYLNYKCLCKVCGIVVPETGHLGLIDSVQFADAWYAPRCHTHCVASVSFMAGENAVSESCGRGYVVHDEATIPIVWSGMRSWHCHTLPGRNDLHDWCFVCWQTSCVMACLEHKIVRSWKLCVHDKAFVYQLFCVVCGRAAVPY